MTTPRPFDTTTDDFDSSVQTVIALSPADRVANDDAPPPLTLCRDCGVIAYTMNPPGWLTSEDEGDHYSYGVCPDCLVNAQLVCAPADHFD